MAEGAGACSAATPRHMESSSTSQKSMADTIRPPGLPIETNSQEGNPRKKETPLMPIGIVGVTC